VHAVIGVLMDDTDPLVTVMVAEEHAPSIVFIDEIDAIGTKTMLELLNQLDGFDSR
uniref:PA700 subunit P56=ATP-dependent 20 S proteasome activator (Fragments) n=1 Tax=Bos taurus TaxID=9913 RepID=Q9TS79_BOVIN